MIVAANRYRRFESMRKSCGRLGSRNCRLFSLPHTIRSMSLSCRKLEFLFLLAVAIPVAVGCSSTDPAEESAQVKPPLSQTAKPEPESSEQDPNSAAPSSQDPNSAIESTKEQVYTPPFPDRVDLFVAPNQKRTEVKSNSRMESTVKLLGFSNVNKPRAVLTIDGSVYSVAEGQETNGIEVVSIKPPAVVLQNGREVWQASLAN